MNWGDLLRAVDPQTARAFVLAARHVVDALLVEVQRVRRTQTPAPRDYPAEQLSRSTPPGGWISDDELRGVAQRMSEAIAAEKWTEGLMLALRALSALGAL